MFNGWSDKPHIKIVDGIHPSELVLHVHRNKAALEEFERIYGNILTYRAIWIKTTNIIARLRDDVIGQNVISKKQEDILKVSLDQLHGSPSCSPKLYDIYSPKSIFLSIWGANGSSQPGLCMIIPKLLYLISWYIFQR